MGDSRALLLTLKQNDRSQIVSASSRMAAGGPQLPLALQTQIQTIYP